MKFRAVPSKPELLESPELFKKNAIFWYPPQIYIRFLSDGDTKICIVVLDLNLGDSHSPSSLVMGNGLMIGAWKDSRLGDDYLNFIVVYLRTARNSSIDNEL